MHSRLLGPTLVAAASFVLSPPILAAQRTFVASTGVDTNPCAIAAPCRSLGTALTNTDPGGEIIVLDSAGYGRVFIAQSVSIVAPKGVYAGISVFATFNGIDVKGTGINVLLRGLTINGQGGNIGIHFDQGASLSVEDCEITGMSSDGIFAAATGAVVTIADTVVRRNAGSGVEIAGEVQASLVRVRAESNGGDGIRVADGARVSVADSSAVNNQTGIHAVTSVAAATQLAADRFDARGNQTGVLVNAVVAGATTLAHVTRSNLSQNANSGMQVCCPAYSGIVTATLSDSIVANSGNTGVTLAAPAATWILTVEGTRIADTAGFALVNLSSAGTFNTRSNNTLSGNAGDVAGTLTPLGGF